MIKSINREKIAKGLFLIFISVIVMFLFELLFMIPGLQEAFLGLMDSDSVWLVYLGYWILIFLQTTIIPIPALTVLFAANKTGMITFNPIEDSTFYILTMSAYMLGIIFAYLIGKKWGKLAIKWVAGTEEEYQHWTQVINQKGKLFYFLTVLFPLFPDDLLCIVAGGVNLDFKFFMISNSVARFIGLVTTVYTLLIAVSSVSNMTMVIIYLAILLITAILWLKFKFFSDFS